MPALFDLIKRSGNQAVEINYAYGIDIALTEHGSDWLWTVFTLLILFCILYFGYAYFAKKPNERFYFTVGAFNLFFMSIGYFTWAANLGRAGAEVEFGHVGVKGNTREIFYCKYIAWFLAYPLLLLNYGVFAAVEWPTLVSTMIAQWVWILAILIGSLITSTYKWGYFVFGICGLFFVWYSLLVNFTRAAIAVDSSNRRFAYVFSGGISFLQFLYPIAWGLSEGGNVIKPDSEAAFFGVIDCLVFLFCQTFFVLSTRNSDFNALGINTGNHAVFHSSEKFAYPASPQITGNTAVPTPAPAPIATQGAPVEPTEV